MKTQSPATQAIDLRSERDSLAGRPLGQGSAGSLRPFQISGAMQRWRNLVLGLAAVASVVQAQQPKPYARDRRVVAELGRVVPGNPGSVDVSLSWRSFHNNLYGDAIERRVDALGNIEQVQAYEAQVAVAGSGQWRSLSDTITGTHDREGRLRTDLHEKQLVFTRADAGEVISDGFFRLAMSYAGVSALDVQQHSTTPPIAFDASEAQVKAALESLDVVSNVQVFRRALAGGAYEWTVLFDPHGLSTFAERVDHDQLPLLSLYTETISAAWTGGGDQVAIQTLRDSRLDHITCSDLCVFDALSLPAGPSYAFRVRALYSTMGWSEWSQATTPLATPSTLVPRAPTVPELMTAKADRLTIKWRMADWANPSTTPALFPVLSYHAQQKCNLDTGWTTITDQLPTGKFAFTFATSLSLSPNASCQFRVAARNANGVGPFSLPSDAFRARSIAPSGELAIQVRRNPMRLVWSAPSSDGGSGISHFDVQFRAFASSTWLQVTPQEVDATNRTCTFQTDRLESYTRYIARVRACNSNGCSAYTESPDFLTDYAVKRGDPDAESAIQLSNRSILVFKSAQGQLPGNVGGRFYVHGIGAGGTNQQVGQNGLLLLFPVLSNGDRLPEQTYFFSGGKQSYRVPKETSHPVVAVDVYGWGAGGGSAGKASTPSAMLFGNGGGGAFVRGLFRVSPGDSVELLVGGGGKTQADSNGRNGGFHGGGDGGIGDFAGAGGGGASELRINGRTVLIAAGGGGGGATDYCCAHGGGGGAGATVGEDGHAPDGSNIPLDESVTHIVRDEYHSQNVESDTRDFVGLPARHLHLDYGAAGSDENYSVLATGGTGASSLAPGRPGLASSYLVSRSGKCFTNPVTSIMEIAAPLTAFSATAGGQSRGGKGQDGKDAGGGGGGGFYGGGGGGSGVDGAGGGGGSSFLSVQDAFDPNTQLAPPSVVAWKHGESVDAFQVTALTSTSVMLTWQPPHYGFSQQVKGFAVEMANRSINQDFRLMRLLDAWANNVTIQDLKAASWYRFRVKVLFRDSSGLYSVIQTMQTPETPLNTWHRITGSAALRGFSEKDTHAGLRFTDPAPSRTFPSARRGHSMTVLEEFLYVFGGFAKGYTCNQGHKNLCLLQPGVNSELWRFDPHTNVWVEVAQPPAGSGLSWPSPREMHSVAVVANRLLLFGGRNGDPTSANHDLWELSVSSTTQKTKTTLQNRESALPIKDGKELFTIGKAGPPSSMCVANMTVQLNITHGCLQTLLIQLLGPGPASFPQRQQGAASPIDSQRSEVRWSDPTGFTSGSHRTTSTIPSARSFPVTLQSPVSASENTRCVSGAQSLSYASAQMPSQPGVGSSFEALSVFHQLSASGGWTLSISDTIADHKQGTLDAWDVSFSLVPCIPTFTWTNLSAVVAGTPPSARFQHTAVVRSSSMFIFGGRNGTNSRELSDMYRLDYLPNGGPCQWIQLLPLQAANPFMDEKRFYLGRLLLLTPYELLAVGLGLRSPRKIGHPHHFGSGLYVGQKSLTDPSNGCQRIDVAVDPNDPAGYPMPRYWAASVFFPNAGRPRVYLFGGQDDTALLDDFWQLDLNLMAEQTTQDSVAGQRRETCDWRMASTGLQKRWGDSCGAVNSSSAAVECSIEMLLLYTWCNQTDQSILL